MKKFCKLIGFLVVLTAVLAAFCSVSFASDQQYTEDLIPTMTSDTVPDGVVSAIGSTGTHYSWKAFDKNLSSYWGPGT
ncbi:MAG TPA: hypothetical protein VHP38_16090, partial [Ruminiclostridium sp.]|nr:hypothetical protein [Ruminiclostridium sp.]